MRNVLNKTWSAFRVKLFQDSLNVTRLECEILVMFECRYQVIWTTYGLIFGAKVTLWDLAEIVD